MTDTQDYRSSARPPHPEPVEGSMGQRVKEAIMSPAMYILSCSDGSYYTGSTTNLEYRVATHKLGLGGRWTCQDSRFRLCSRKTFHHCGRRSRRSGRSRVGVAQRSEHWLREASSCYPNCPKTIRVTVGGVDPSTGSGWGRV